MTKTATGLNVEAAQAIQLAADAAMASDKAEDDVSRQQAHTQHLDRKELASFLHWRWVERVTPFLRAMADPTRLRVIGLLIEEEPREVGALAKDLKVRSSTMSQHMAMLRDARIVVMLKDGNRSKCFLNRPYMGWRLKQVAEKLDVAQ
jgi:DNA-binding transcriptional ArsR family regulator